MLCYSGARETGADWGAEEEGVRLTNGSAEEGSEGEEAPEEDWGVQGETCHGEDRTTKDRLWSQSVAESGRWGTVTIISFHSIK